MNVDPWNIAALLLGLVAMLFAIKRECNRPAVTVSREAELVKQVEQLRNDVAALQRMLTEKQTEIDQLTKRIWQLEQAAPAEQPAPKTPKARKPLLAVAIGPDPMLEVDVAALRGIAAFQLAVLQNASKGDLEALLERHRAAGNPIRHLHIATHANHQGLAFAGGMADGLWLSKHLSGVQVLVLAGCESDRVADLLSVVPAVVSMRDEIDNRDASLFSRAFWTAIGQGQDAQAALDWAIERSPAIVAEMVDLHL